MAATQETNFKCPAELDSYLRASKSRGVVHWKLGFDELKKARFLAAVLDTGEKVTLDESIEWKCQRTPESPHLCCVLYRKSSPWIYCNWDYVSIAPSTTEGQPHPPDADNVAGAILAARLRWQKEGQSSLQTKSLQVVSSDLLGHLLLNCRAYPEISVDCKSPLASVCVPSVDGSSKKESEIKAPPPATISSPSPSISSRVHVEYTQDATTKTWSMQLQVLPSTSKLSQIPLHLICLEGVWKYHDWCSGKDIYVQIHEGALYSILPILPLEERLQKLHGITTIRPDHSITTSKIWFPSSSESPPHRLVLSGRFEVQSDHLMLTYENKEKISGLMVSVDRIVFPGSLESTEFSNSFRHSFKWKRIP